MNQKEPAVFPYNDSDFWWRVCNNVSVQLASIRCLNAPEYARLLKVADECNRRYELALMLEEISGRHFND